MLSYVRGLLRGDDVVPSGSAARFPFRDRYDHTLRVLTWAERLMEREGGDPFVVTTAAIFHDCGKGREGDRPHAQVSAELCEAYLLGQGIPPGSVDDVVRTVWVHSDKEDTSTCFTREQEILMDADSLDELGATCVVWDAMDEGMHEGCTYATAYQRMVGSLEANRLKPAMMRTLEGRLAYAQRLRAMDDFLRELRFELGESVD